MAGENLFVRIKAIDDFSGTFNKVEDSTKKFGKGAAVAGAVAATAFAAVGVALYSCAKEAIEAEKVTAQTNSVIKSTGGIAKVTAKDVDDLATAISRKSGIDDETIKSGENLLLTFTNIRNEAGAGNDIFNQSTKLMADLSVRFGMDMPSAAKMMGKALNDPIKGITALSRAGVQFSAGQKEQIANFMAAGDIMSAQKVILAELTTQVGGAAEAYGNTFAGKVDRLKVLFDEIKEKIGTKVVDALNKFADWVLRNWPTIEKVITTACNVIGDVWSALQSAADWLGGAIEKSVNFIISAWNGLSKYAQIAWTEIRIWVETGVLAILNAVSKFVSAMAKVPILGKAFKGIDADLKSAVDSIKGNIADARGELDRLNGNAEKNTTEVAKSFNRLEKQAGGDFAKMYEKFQKAQADGNPKIAAGAKGAMTNILNAILAGTPGVTGNTKKCVDLMVAQITKKDFKMPTGQKLQEMATAISANSGVPVSQVLAMLGQMTGAITNTDTVTPGAGLANGVAVGVAAGAGAVRNQGINLGASAADGVNSQQGAASDAGRQVAAAVAAGVAAYGPINITLGVKKSGGGPVTLETGGPVQQFASGGMSKPVPAVLHTGEYVIRKKAVDNVGVRTLDAINRNGNVSGGVTVNISAGAFLGSKGEARRFASEIKRLLAAEGAR